MQEPGQESIPKLAEQLWEMIRNNAPYQKIEEFLNQHPAKRVEVILHKDAERYSYYEGSNAVMCASRVNPQIALNIINLLSSSGQLTDELKKQLYTEKDPGGYSPLMLACLDRKNPGPALALFEILDQLQVSVVNEACETKALDGNTAFFYACQNNPAAAMAILAKLNPNQVFQFCNTQNDEGNTPFISACSRSPEVAIAILKKLNPKDVSELCNTRNKNGVTPLISACDSPKVAIEILNLVEPETLAQFFNSKDKDGSTALMTTLMMSRFYKDPAKKLQLANRILTKLQPKEAAEACSAIDRNNDNALIHACRSSLRDIPAILDALSFDQEMLLQAVIANNNRALQTLVDMAKSHNREEDKKPYYNAINQILDKLTPEQVRDIKKNLKDSNALKDAMFSQLIEDHSNKRPHDIQIRRKEEPLFGYLLNNSLGKDLPVDAKDSFDKMIAYGKTLSAQLKEPISDTMKQKIKTKLFALQDFVTAATSEKATLESVKEAFYEFEKNDVNRGHGFYSIVAWLKGKTYDDGQKKADRPPLVKSALGEKGYDFFKDYEKAKQSEKNQSQPLSQGGSQNNR